MSRIILSFFLSGLFLGSGPCLVTCGPILVSYIVATKQNPKQAFFIWLLFSLGRVIIYLLLSLSIFLLGEFIVRQNLISIGNYLYLVGGITIILIGCFTIISSSANESWFCSVVLRGLEQRLARLSPVTLGFILGLLPCAPLLAVLSYIGLVSSSWQLSIFYSLIFGSGTLISPLVFLALGAGVIPKILFNRPKTHRLIRIISAAIIIFFGTQLILQFTHGKIILP